MTCTHRDAGIVGMVGWHNVVGSAPRANFWTDGDNAIAFSKGNRGWVAFNNGPAAKSISVQAGLSKGRYCDVVLGTPTQSGCANGSAPVVLNAQGVATVTVGARCGGHRPGQQALTRRLAPSRPAAARSGSALDEHRHGPGRNRCGPGRGVPRRGLDDRVRPSRLDR